MPTFNEVLWAYLAHLKPSLIDPYLGLKLALPEERPPQVPVELWARAEAQAGAARWLQRDDIRVVRWADPDYPSALTTLANPPAFLFMQGRAELLERDPLAIVGTRRCSADGAWAAEMLAASSSSAGVPVISGLALGIDGAAHRGALEGRGGTIAVLPGGLLCISPQSHRGLADRIRREGLLLSEVPPDCGAVQAWRFVERNRLIAALARAVLVVEAGEPSGALGTVRHAQRLGRPVWSVPGSIRLDSTRGSNALLRRGAEAVPSVLDLLKLLGATRCEPPQGGSPAPVVSLEPLPAQQLALLWGVDEPTARRTLIDLELHGRVRRLPGDRYQAVGAAGFSLPQELH